jgi:hypothetical protein
MMHINLKAKHDNPDTQMIHHKINNNKSDKKLYIQHKQTTIKYSTSVVEKYS